MTDEAKVIRMAPDAEGVMHMLPENEVLMDDEALEAIAVCHALYKFCAGQGAHFSLVHDHKHPGQFEWSVMLNFGEEAPGSPMAAGSALGDGETALEAIKMALKEAGVEWEVPGE
jgi:hypothetical protein